MATAAEVAQAARALRDAEQAAERAGNQPAYEMVRDWENKTADYTAARARADELRVALDQALATYEED